MKTKDIKITPKWSKSKEEIWEEVFSSLELKKSSPRTGRISFWKYTAAAMIALLAATGSFAYLYKTTEYTPRGSHRVVILPDGSTVSLNADSELRYKPFWWYVSRSVELKGEAYFEVNSGSRFTVESYHNEVRVLGTSFNVFSRAENFCVTCLTGKVEVRTKKDKITLYPNMQINVRGQNLNISEGIDGLQFIGWTERKFSFLGVPLEDVVKEIERQYDIQVAADSKLDYLYTGSFSKEKKPEEVLEIIGKPFGISFKIRP